MKKETDIQCDFQDAWGFGDNPELLDELLQLVLEGKKTATTTLIKENELEGWPTPVVGAYNIILDGRENSAAVIKTVSLRRARFKDVDAEFAHREGEDKRTLEAYFREHRKYYKRTGERPGFKFNQEMEVYLKRFELVYPR